MNFIAFYCNDNRGTVPSFMVSVVVEKYISGLRIYVCDCFYKFCVAIETNVKIFNKPKVSTLTEVYNFVLFCKSLCNELTS